MCHTECNQKHDTRHSGPFVKQMVRSNFDLHLNVIRSR